jgi:2-polyprenyl-3-methyl-5-hydroxy-6-metoxy-1,4-benzoquinol methylase
MNPYIQLPRAPVVSDRHALILEKCQGKRVLHLGCVDAGLLYERFQSGELMHHRLASVASELWGVDVDVEGITFLRSKGFNNLIIGDVCELDKIDRLRGQTFEVIVTSEVIEHLQNPGLFLSAVQTLMTPETELIITVPNAFRLDTLTWLLRGVEFVHPDHNYWFSYHTITNLVQKSGFTLKDVYVYSFQYRTVLPAGIRRSFNHTGDKDVAKSEGVAFASSVSVPFLNRLVNYFRSVPKRLLISFLYKRTPFWGDGIIVVAQRNLVR